ncbi:hypothetical protein Gotur_024948 [Gossypium turneri]
MTDGYLATVAILGNVVINKQNFEQCIIDLNCFGLKGEKWLSWNVIV